jgi:hypothetical protein
MPVQNDDTIVGVKIDLSVKFNEEFNRFKILLNVVLSFIFRLGALDPGVFFHFMPDAGEVVAMADRSFQAL